MIFNWLWGCRDLYESLDGLSHYQIYLTQNNFIENLTEPDHERARNNKQFFDYQLAQEAKAKRGDLGSADEEETEGEQKEETQQEFDPRGSTDEEGEYQPVRPKDFLPERYAYEALCRGDKDQVKVMACSTEIYVSSMKVLENVK